MTLDEIGTTKCSKELTVMLKAKGFVQVEDDVIIYDAMKFLAEIYNIHIEYAQSYDKDTLEEYMIAGIRKGGFYGKWEEVFFKQDLNQPVDAFEKAITYSLENLCHTPLETPACHIFFPRTMG